MFPARGLGPYFLLLCVTAIVSRTIPAYARVDAPHRPVDPRSVDGSELGAPIDISSTWLLQQGDDPHYADSSLDDSRWLVAEASCFSLSTYGLKNVDLVWYRTHVHVPAHARNLAIYLDRFAGSEQIFVNGWEIGSSGPFPPGGDVIDFNTRHYPIPDSALSGGDLTIAIRASIGRQSHFGTMPGGLTPFTTILLGTAPTIADAYSLHAFRAFSPLAIHIVGAIIELISIALALRLPSEREYLALFLWVGSAMVLVGLTAVQAWASIPDSVLLLVFAGILTACGEICMVEFVRIVLGLRRSHLFAGYEWLIGLTILLKVLYADMTNLSGASSAFATGFGWLEPIVLVPAIIGTPFLALYIWRKRRNPDGLLLSIPFFSRSIYFSWWCGAAIFYSFHLISSPILSPPPVQAMYLGWDDIENFVFGIALMLFLILRTLRVVRARARAQAELDAAQAMQQVLLSSASKPTPGFEVESVYRPAGDVGGDFFLISPGADNSLTTIVGDVSGKGFAAAMRVSMILGVLRREDSRDPCMILTRLNEALLAQGDMGFTTACCVRLDRSGNYCVANAGHISPYSGGNEIATSPSLPLGLATEQNYEVVYGTLYSGQKLVLMSDGVVEARSPKGELYGFSRLSSLTLKPAREIAETAQRFGQEDDITVVTIACCASAHPGRDGLLPRPG